VVAVRLSSAPDQESTLYYDNLWSTLLRYLSGANTEEHARRLAALSGNDVSLLRAAGALMHDRPDDPERALALSLIDLAVLRAGQAVAG
jgi:hypothetical protein